jgi:hypothetical protein
MRSPLDAPTPSPRPTTHWSFPDSASVWRSSVPGESTTPMIAADTIAALAHPTGTGAALLPVANLRTVSTAVAIAVAQAAVEHGLAAQPLTDPYAKFTKQMWRPDYPPFEPI